jgi:hypothetical protein
LLEYEVIIATEEGRWLQHHRGRRLGRRRSLSSQPSSVRQLTFRFSKAVAHKVEHHIITAFHLPFVVLPSWSSYDVDVGATAPRPKSSDLAALAILISRLTFVREDGLGGQRGHLVEGSE